MDKVYFNLLSNAFKFTQQRKISIVINEDKLKNQVKISFKDSGIGIPENELKEVFSAFYQGSTILEIARYRSPSVQKFVDLHKEVSKFNRKMELSLL
jgi:K+-sensing histidine kinase KdpD